MKFSVKLALSNDWKKFWIILDMVHPPRSTEKRTDGNINIDVHISSKCPLDALFPFLIASITRLTKNHCMWVCLNLRAEMIFNLNQLELIVSIVHLLCLRQAGPEVTARYRTMTGLELAFSGSSSSSCYAWPPCLAFFTLIEN